MNKTLPDALMPENRLDAVGLHLPECAKAASPVCSGISDTDEHQLQQNVSAAAGNSGTVNQETSEEESPNMKSGADFHPEYSHVAENTALKLSESPYNSPKDFVENNRERIEHQITDELVAYLSRRSGISAGIIRMQLKTFMDLSETGKSGYRFNASYNYSPLVVRNVPRWFTLFSCNKEGIEIVSKKIAVEVAKDLCEYAFKEEYAEKTFSPYPGSLSPIFPKRYPQVVSHPAPQIDLDHFSFEIAEMLTNDFEKDFKREEQGWLEGIQIAASIISGKKKVWEKKQRKTIIRYSLSCSVVLPLLNLENSVLVDPQDTYCFGHGLLTDEENQMLKRTIVNELLFEIHRLLHVGIKRETQKRIAAIADEYTQSAAKQCVGQLQDYSDWYHVTICSSSIQLDLCDSSKTRVKYSRISLGQVQEQLKKHLQNKFSDNIQLGPSVFSREIQEKMKNAVKDQMQKIVEQLKKQLLTPRVERGLFHEILERMRLWHPMDPLIQDLQHMHQEYRASIPDLLKAWKTVPKKETCLTVSLTEHDMRIEVKDPVCSGIYSIALNNLQVGNWESQNISSTLKKIRQENGQHLRNAAVEYALSLQNAIPNGLQIRRCTGDGLLFGAGDFELRGTAAKDPPLRKKLKTSSYWKDFEKWKLDVQIFFEKLVQEYPEFQKAEIVTKTSSALRYVTGFAKRDMVEVLCNTPYMSLEVLTCMLAGKKYETFHEIYRVKELAGRYKEIYTSRELVEMAGELDQMDVIRLSQVDYRYHNYARAAALKKARDMNVLIDGSYEFSRDHLIEVCRNTNQDLSDFEAEYLYLQAKKESENFTKELPTPDYMPLVRSFNSLGFVAVYQKEIRTYFPRFPSRILKMIRMYAPFQKNPLVQKLMIQVSELPDGSATAGISSNIRQSQAPAVHPA